MIRVETAYFRLLGSLLYNEPSVEVINALKKDSVFTELPYAQDNELARKGQAQLNRWSESGSNDSLTDEAREVYISLLVGLGKVLAAPWGSVYMDEDRLLFGEDTLGVRQYYEHYGMMVKQKYKEPDDHIGLELEFLAYLFEKNEAEAAVKFAERYISPWIFKWNDDVQKYAKTAYYKGIANMATAGIEVLCGI